MAHLRVRKEASLTQHRCLCFQAPGNWPLGPNHQNQTGPPPPRAGDLGSLQQPAEACSCCHATQSNPSLKPLVWGGSAFWSSPVGSRSPWTSLTDTGWEQGITAPREVGGREDPALRSHLQSDHRTCSDTRWSTDTVPSEEVLRQVAGRRQALSRPREAFPTTVPPVTRDEQQGTTDSTVVPRLAPGAHPQQHFSAFLMAVPLPRPGTCTQGAPHRATPPAPSPGSLLFRDKAF